MTALAYELAHALDVVSYLDRDGCVGLSWIPFSDALLYMARSVRPSFRPMTLAGVFCLARVLSLATSCFVHCLPEFLVDLAIPVTSDWSHNGRSVARPGADTAHRVDRITDKKGMRIDGEIKEPVTALLVHGFPTRQSCEGHLDTHGHPYPWIFIDAPDPEERVSDEDKKEQWTIANLREQKNA